VDGGSAISRRWPPYFMTEIIWSAGFFEGDGCISVSTNSRQIRLSIEQASLERLERIQSALGVGNINGPHGPYGISKLARYTWSVNRKKDVKKAMNLMWPYLGPTTRQRLRDCLDVL